MFVDLFLHQQHFIPNDVLGRLLTFDMQREEANERRKLS